MRPTLAEDPEWHFPHQRERKACGMSKITVGQCRQKSRGAIRTCAIVVAAVVAGLLTAPLPASAAISYNDWNRVENRQDTRLCLEVDGAAWWGGAPVAVDWCEGQGHQRWRVVNTWPQDGRVQLLVEHTGQCLSVVWQASWGVWQNQGSSVVQEDCQWAQRWRLTYNAGWSEIRARPPGMAGELCLDKAGWGVTVWSCHGAQWQQWG